MKLSALETLLLHGRWLIVVEDWIIRPERETRE